MVEFKSYPDIENSYQQGFISKIKERGYGNIRYVVTEKIHGANTQVSYDARTGEFFYGKRSAFLEEGEAFYNFQQCAGKAKEKVALLAGLLKDELAGFGQELLSVTVFGEVFGGSYPHMDIKIDKTALKVQKGVFYSPSNEWLVFDVAYTVAGSDRRHFLSWAKMFNFCFAVGLATVPALGEVDSLDGALAYPNDGMSRVYEMYGLPAIEDNIMEGVVIRPYLADVWFGDTRLILKNKNEKFKEKSRVKKNEPPQEVPEQVKKACEEISQYINANRAHNVISHIGEVTAKDIGKVIMEMSKDVLADYRKDYDTLDKLEKKDEKMVTKYLSGEVAKVVRDIIVFGKE